MHSSKTKYTKAQLKHLNIDIYYNDSFVALNKYGTDYEASIGKFKNIVRTIYKSDNPVSLCNNVIFGLSENVPADVKAFVANWLLKSVPVIQGAPDDETAFNSIIPRGVGTMTELVPYLDKLESIVNNVSNVESPKPNT